MHSYLSTKATLMSLLAFMPLALALEQSTIIHIPNCSADGHGDAHKIWEGKSETCQADILRLYTRGGEILTAPASGCTEVVAASQCSVWLCNNGRGSKATISVGALANAAQDIHSYCRLNGKVGGRVTVSAHTGKPDDSVMVQLGQIHKDELKMLRRNGQIPDREVHAPLDVKYDPTQHREMRRGKRSDDSEDIDHSPGTNEGPEMNISIFQQLQIRDALITDIRRVLDEPNPNFRNTAQAQRTFGQGDGRTITVTMGYLGRDGRTIEDLRDITRDARLNTLLGTIIGQWHAAGRRALWSSHVFRFWRNAPDQHVELGEVMIEVTEGPGDGILLPMHGGSR